MWVYIRTIHGSYGVCFSGISVRCGSHLFVSIFVSKVSFPVNIAKFPVEKTQPTSAAKTHDLDLGIWTSGCRESLLVL